MPAWSPVVAWEFIRLGNEDGKSFNQMQLQKLVYIAHGTCLAMTGEPLTGDRPEAMEFGPTYKRLSDKLIRFGRDPVTEEPENSRNAYSNQKASDLDEFELDVIRRVYEDYSEFSAAKLAILTRREGSPWEGIYAGGAGRSRDISHQLIRIQFEQIVTRKEEPVHRR